MTFGMAAKKFFGYKPGQDLKGFMAELKTLTPKDREELAPFLEKELKASGELPQSETVTFAAER